jgi:hypothetical protein
LIKIFKQTNSTVRLDFHQNSSTFSNRKFTKIAIAGKFTHLPDMARAHGPADLAAVWLLHGALVLHAFSRLTRYACVHTVNIYTLQAGGMVSRGRF